MSTIPTGGPTLPTMPADDPPYQPPSPWRKLIGWNMLGVGILALALILSVASLLSVRARHYDDSSGRKIVRILHWQLELGFRQALQRVIDDYNKLKAAEFAAGRIPAPVEVLQMGVTEKVYDQFVKTNLIAGTAPDLIETKRYSTSSQDRSQYFLELGDVIEQPNPYNADRFLADPAVAADLRQAFPVLPWRNTFIEGLRSGWDNQLQGFYGIPITCFMGGRLSFNIDLVKAATGSEKLPRTLGELLSVCRQIRAYGKSQGRDIIPIASSRYDTAFWRAYISSFTAINQDLLDLDLSGDVSDTEGWAAIGSGRLAFSDPPYRDLIESSAAISAEFSPGFLAMERDTASFLFIQGKAAMHFTGSWDAGTLARQVPFRMGVIPMPLPAPGEPWGDPPRAQVDESGGLGGAPFAIVKNSRNVTEAIDFMQYLTSHDVNQRFNQECDWLPTIIGCTVSPLMAPYSPQVDGVGGDAGWVPGGSGGQVTSVFNGCMLQIISGETTFPRLVAEVEALFTDDTYGWKAIWANAHDSCKINHRANQRTMSGRLLRDFLLPDQGDRKARLNLVAGGIALNGEAQRQLFGKTMGAAGHPFPEVDR